MNCCFSWCRPSRGRRRSTSPSGHRLPEAHRFYLPSASVRPFSSSGGNNGGGGGGGGGGVGGGLGLAATSPPQPVPAITLFWPPPVLLPYIQQPTGTPSTVVVGAGVGGAKREIVPWTPIGSDPSQVFLQFHEDDFQDPQQQNRLHQQHQQLEGAYAVLGVAEEQAYQGDEGPSRSWRPLCPLIRTRVYNCALDPSSEISHQLFSEPTNMLEQQQQQPRQCGPRPSSGRRGWSSHWDSPESPGSPVNEPSEDRQCAFCRLQPKSVVFLPCRHVCCCGNCASLVFACPVCRMEIDQRIDIYL
eukprot:NODE_1879_length_1371_cov_20.810893_g1700_i0.p1 GENE.NODE_1879_length_1371_cov_20.810893_g1700_i0~~NODE_1879_length_1371_cov_20.810893_g1700_i0.p1  ORF type:complete len:301 (-),score=32.19 NODE_1879_length_1371_cov_20.810893_g1700_i0:353-1255(-)